MFRSGSWAIHGRSFDSVNDSCAHTPSICTETGIPRTSDTGGVRTLPYYRLSVPRQSRSSIRGSCLIHLRPTTSLPPTDSILDFLLTLHRSSSSALTSSSVNCSGHTGPTRWERVVEWVTGVCYVIEDGGTEKSTGGWVDLTEGGRIVGIEG